MAALAHRPAGFSHSLLGCCGSPGACFYSWLCCCCASHEVVSFAKPEDATMDLVSMCCTLVPYCGWAVRCYYTYRRRDAFRAIVGLRPMNFCECCVELGCCSCCALTQELVEARERLATLSGSAKGVATVRVVSAGGTQYIAMPVKETTRRAASAAESLGDEDAGGDAAAEGDPAPRGRSKSPAPRAAADGVRKRAGSVARGGSGGSAKAAPPRSGSGY